MLTDVSGETVVLGPLSVGDIVDAFNEDLPARGACSCDPNFSVL